MRDGDNRVTGSKHRYRHWPLPNLNTTPHQNYCYIMGSLANRKIRGVASKMRDRLPEWAIFDDWHAAHPKADDSWRTYELSKGHCYEKALREPAAQNVFMFDKKYLDRATHGLMILPCGRSAHLELGYLRGRECGTAILLDGKHDRWDVMYAFADIVTHDIEEIIASWGS